MRRVGGAAESLAHERSLAERVGHAKMLAPLTWRAVSKEGEVIRRPQVRVLLHGAYRGFAGGARELTLDATNIREALAGLVQAHPTLAERLRDERGRLRPHLALFINQDDARLLGWEDAPLREGDIVHVIPALSGG